MADGKKPGIVIIVVAIAFFSLIVFLNIEDTSISKFFGTGDTDTDGVPDRSDNCPNTINPEQEDFDSDKIGNVCDFDDDNDGIVDALDAFDQNPDEWADFDFDGIGSNQDKDDDNDGILDKEDPTPIPISEKLTQQHMTEIERCIVQDITNYLICYGNFFTSLTEQEVNYEDTLDLAHTLQQIGAIDDCHFVAHTLGHEYFDETKNLNLKNFELYGALCRGGYFHGAMGGFFHNLKDTNEPVPDNYKTICNDLLGKSTYVVCVHGLGHGLLNYYPTNIEVVFDLCNQMPFYHYFACSSGAMMQYTDNQLTEFGATKENINNMCSESELNEFEYSICTGNIGISLAFHNNHKDGTKLYCNLLDNEKGKAACLTDVKLEIQKYKAVKQKLFSEKEKSKLQPQWIKQGDKKWAVDFFSPAIISNFDYNEETKKMQFSFDEPNVIKIYAWDKLFPEKFVVSINGVNEKFEIEYDEVEPITKIMISPTKSGTVLISSG